MRVVDISSFFPKTCGGIKRYYLEKARVMPGLGVDCHFVVPGEEDVAEPFGGGTLHRVAGPPMPGNDAYRIFPPRADLSGVLRAIGPDIVELGSHYFLPSMVRRALRAVGTRATVVGFFHSHPAQIVEHVVHRVPGRLGSRALEDVMWSIFRRQHARYDATLVASRTMERLVTAQGIPRVRWVGLGVDVDTFRPARDPARELARAPGAPVRVVYAGRFTTDKELPLLLEAFERVSARTGAHLSLYGDGPLAGELRAAAATRPDVTVEGYIDGPASMARILTEADVVVVPSATETFSLVTAEALASGTPVIGADEGATGDLVLGSGGGALFRARDPRSLADTLERIVTLSPAHRRALGDAGRAHIVDQYSWTAVMTRLAGVYADLRPELRQAA